MPTISLGTTTSGRQQAIDYYKEQREYRMAAYEAFDFKLHPSIVNRTLQYRYGAICQICLEPLDNDWIQTWAHGYMHRRCADEQMVQGTDYCI